MKRNILFIASLFVIAVWSCKKKDAGGSQACSCGSQVQTYANGNDTFVLVNAFTPNFNGRNDQFRPVHNFGFSVQEYKMSIYRSDGQLVFETTDPMASWNGRDQNTNMQDAGVYKMELSFKGDDNQQHDYCDCINLVKYNECIDTAGTGLKLYFEDQIDIDFWKVQYTSGEKFCK